MGELNKAVLAAVLTATSLCGAGEPSAPLAKTLKYGAEKRRELDLYMPPTKSGEAIPCVVFIHGGGWKGGSREKAKSLPFGSAFEGVAVASISYKLSAGKDLAWPENIEDCRAAIAFLKANAKSLGLDPERFATMGESAGGHLALLAAYWNGDPSIKAVIDVFGVSDVSEFMLQHPSARWGQMFLEGPYEKRRELYALASPLEHVSEKCPPTLILHGTKDRTVPPSQSERLEKALKEKDVRVEFVRLDIDHSFGDFAKSAEAAKAVRAFLERELKPIRNQR